MTNIIRSLGKIYAAFLGWVCVLSAPLFAAPLALPDGAQLVYEQDMGLGVALFGAGPADDAGAIATISAKGELAQRVWRIPRGDVSPLQMIDGLRVQLQSMGYTAVYECAAQACGGFDFRYALDPTPPTALYVNLSNYYYLLAQRGADDLIWLLASSDGAAGYIQIKSIGPVARAAAAVPKPPAPSAPVAKPVNMVKALHDMGRAVIPGVDFMAGSTDLSQGPQVGLDQLVKLMTDDPMMRLVLVGHTDNNGPFDVNLDLSQKRAEAARAYLLENGIDPARIEARGVSYLLPLASNATPEGRRANRRVEAVVLMPSQN